MIQFLPSLITTAVSAVTQLATVIGPVISKLAVLVAELAPVVDKVMLIVQAVGDLLGVLKPGESVSVMGEKATQSNKKPDDFTRYSDYIDHLRQEVPLDKEKFDNASDVDKLIRAAVGTAVVIKTIEEHKGFEIPLNAWTALATMGFEGKSGKEVGAVIGAFKGDFTTLSEYAKGELSVKKDIETTSVLESMYKELEPNSSGAEIKEKVTQLVG